jgi:hypothetical protein
MTDKVDIATSLSWSAGLDQQALQIAAFPTPTPNSGQAEIHPIAEFQSQ